MAEVTADGAGVGGHGDGLDAEAGEGAHVGEHHLAVGDDGAGVVDVEAVGVFHEEFAAAHDAEAGADFVAEFPLDVVEVLRQFAIGLDALAEDVGDHFLVGGAEEHVAVVAVFQAEHFLAVAVVAAGLAPEVGGLHGGHEDFLGA